MSDAVGGGSLINFIKLGFRPENLTGIDIQQERISEAKMRFPNINFVHGDASKMQFNDETFEIVIESTMFVQLTDEDLARSIANEMIRTTKTDGYIILVDWKYSKPWDKSYKGLDKKRTKELFGVGSKTNIEGIYNGAIVPPIGRFLSKRIPSIYFVIQTILPFLVGQKTTVLKKVKQ